MRVNRYNLTEVKVREPSFARPLTFQHALDDAVREYLDAVSYKSSHRHEDVRLGLGWSACLISCGISLYGLRVPFAETKTLIFVAVVACVLVCRLRC